MVREAEASARHAADRVVKQSLEPPVPRFAMLVIVGLLEKLLPVEPPSPIE